MKSRSIVPVVVAAILALALSACSSGGGDSGIASIQKTTAQPSASASSGTSEEQALAFSQCMRDNGVADFPDPTVDADGNPSFANAFTQGQSGGFNPSDDSFRTAMTACSDKLGDIAFGGGRAGGNFDTQAIQDALLTYTQCLRDQGLDVGDITFGNGAGGQGGAQPTVQPTAPPADGGAPPSGQAGPGGDNTDRFATQLGQDPTDPAWIAANKVCQPVLQKAMTAAGIGTGTNG